MEPLTIIGTGSLGTALGILLARANWPIVGISSRDHSKALVASLKIGCPAFPDPLEPVRSSRLVLLTVSDDAIAPMAQKLKPALGADTLLVHASGVHGPEILGHRPGLAMHPLQSVPDPEAGVKRLPGSTFTLEGDELERGRQLVHAVKGHPVTMQPGDRALYHAAAAIISTGLVASFAVATRLCERHGLEQKDLWPLAHGTLHNLQDRRPEQALTGPAARGDWGTLERHWNALKQEFPEALPYYRALTGLALKLAGRPETKLEMLE